LHLRKIGIQYNTFTDDEDELLMNLHHGNFSQNETVLSQSQDILIPFSNLTVLVTYDGSDPVRFPYHDFNTGKVKQLVEYTLTNDDAWMLTYLL
jgi:hypothetical protein